VRTITVWHGSDRYMPELRSWWLKNRGTYTDDKNFVASVTSATRSAGKYSVKWDGKDDKGNVVKPGKYILKLEISRSGRIRQKSLRS
jgi:thiamine biosynthesis lipoprotein